MIFLILLADDFFEPLLMRRIQKCPQERDDKATRAPVDQPVDFFAGIVLVQRAHDPPAPIDAFFDTGDHPARDERNGLLLDGQVAALM